jgi:hypothetical protein
LNAYRKDLADVALAGKVIASHYAMPVARRVLNGAILKKAPSIQSEAVCELCSTDQFLMLDDTLGWAWGFAASTHQVGYVQSNYLDAQQGH